MIKRVYKVFTLLLSVLLIFTSLSTVAMAADDCGEENETTSVSSGEQNENNLEDESTIDIDECGNLSVSCDELLNVDEMEVSTEDIANVESDSVTELDVNTDEMVDEDLESVILEQDLVDAYTLSGSLETITDFDITVTDIRGSQYSSHLVGKDGTPKLLIFGGVSSCGQTNSVIDSVNRLYNSIDGNLEVYIFDIKNNTDSDIISFLDSHNISKNIRVASKNASSSYLSLYSTCVWAANISGSWSMPLMAYADGRGNIVYTSLSYQNEYAISYRMLNELDVKVKYEVTNISSTMFPADYSVTIKTGEISRYSFVPKTSGNYTFDFSSGDAPYAVIYERTGNRLKVSIFEDIMSQELEAGKEYIIEIINYYTSSSGSPISMTFKMSVKTDAIITPYDPSYKGIIKDEATGKWYYVNNGYVDTSYTGFAKNASNGKTYYVKNGEVDWACTSLMKEASTGKWYYVQKGQVNFDYVGLAKNVANGHWYYVNKGAISWNFTGLAKNPANGHWYYVNKGEIDWKYCGLAKNSANGNWYYVKNGEIDFKFTGIAKNIANGNYYYVKNGQLDWNFSGKYYDSTLKRTFTVTKGVAK